MLFIVNERPAGARGPGPAGDVKTEPDDDGWNSDFRLGASGDSSSVGSQSQPHQNAARTFGSGAARASGTEATPNIKQEPLWNDHDDSKGRAISIENFWTRELLSFQQSSGQMLRL